MKEQLGRLLPINNPRRSDADYVSRVRLAIVSRATESAVIIESQRRSLRITPKLLRPKKRVSWLSSDERRQN